MKKTEGTDSVLLIAFNRPVTGRETVAAKLMATTTAHLANATQEGLIDGYTAVRLTPHGGDLNEFILVRGTRAKLTQLRRTEAIEAVTQRGQLDLQGFGMVTGATGPRLETWRRRTQESISER